MIETGTISHVSQPGFPSVGADLHHRDTADVFRSPKDPCNSLAASALAATITTKFACVLIPPVLGVELTSQALSSWYNLGLGRQPRWLNLAKVQAHCCYLAVLLLVIIILLLSSFSSLRTLDPTNDGNLLQTDGQRRLDTPTA